jgi:hypothetical protein
MELTIFDILGYVWPFLQKYGWYLIGLIFTLVLSKPYMERWILKKKQEQSLHQANDPTRVQLLREEMLRIREEQMRNHQQSVEEFKRKQQEKQDREKLEAAEKENEWATLNYGSPGNKLGRGEKVPATTTATTSTTTTTTSPSTTVRSRPPGFFGGNSNNTNNNRNSNGGGGSHRWGSDRMRPKGG